MNIINGEILEWCKILDLTREEVIDKNINSFGFIGDDEKTLFIKNLLQEKSLKNYLMKVEASILRLHIGHLELARVKTVVYYLGLFLILLKCKLMLKNQINKFPNYNI